VDYGEKLLLRLIHALREQEVRMPDDERTALEQRLHNVQERLRQQDDNILNENRDNREGDLREWVEIARGLADAGDLVTALVNLALFLAKEKAAKEMPAADRAAIVAEALEVAGDAVRARQLRGKAIRYGVGDEPTYASVMAGIDFSSTALDLPQAFTVPPPPPDELCSWLVGKGRISSADLAPHFGDFVSNDAGFYRDAMNMLTMLERRLRNHLGKPDNYLLLAEPGSGKSFFVKEFAKELTRVLGRQNEIVYLERNLSVYSSVDQAFTDIVMDLVAALLWRRPVVLFIDEVDTQLDGQNIFQRLIAPMNGDPFHFLQKQLSFARQDLVVFYALSSRLEDITAARKWPDFLSRIPQRHQIRLPAFASVVDRIYRAAGILPREPFGVTRVQAAALVYIGLYSWTSSRTFEQELALAKMRMPPNHHVLELVHVAPAYEDIDALTKETGVDIFACDPDAVIEIVPG
jgi:hypothetical protein